MELIRRKLEVYRKHRGDTENIELKDKFKAVSALVKEEVGKAKLKYFSEAFEVNIKGLALGYVDEISSVYTVVQLHGVGHIEADFSHEIQLKENFLHLNIEQTIYNLQFEQLILSLVIMNTSHNSAFVVLIVATLAALYTVWYNDYWE